MDLLRLVISSFPCARDGIQWRHTMKKVVLSVVGCFSQTHYIAPTSFHFPSQNALSEKRTSVAGFSSKQLGTRWRTCGLLQLLSLMMSSNNRQSANRIGILLPYTSFHQLSQLVPPLSFRSHFWKRFKSQVLLFSCCLSLRIQSRPNRNAKSKQNSSDSLLSIHFKSTTFILGLCSAHFLHRQIFDNAWLLLYFFHLEHFNETSSAQRIGRHLKFPTFCYSFYANCEIPCH